MKTLVLICILVYQSLCEILPSKSGRISQTSLDQDYQTTTTTTTSGSSSKKGMTWNVAVWPSQQNSNAMRVACSNCDPYQGDTPCTERLPVLCLIDAYTLQRVFYNFNR